MIVKSALVFLSIVDFVWDSLEKTIGFINKLKVNKAMSASLTEQAKPSYSIR